MDYGLLILEILGYNHKDTVKYTSLNNEYLLISMLKHFKILYPSVKSIFPMLMMEKPRLLSNLSRTTQ